MSRERLQLVMIIAVLALEGLYGALATIRVRQQVWPWWTIMLGGFLSQAVWIYLAKFGRIKLVYASVLFDIAYNGIWFLAIVCLGEALKPIHAVGVAMTIIGIALLGF